MGKRTGEKYMPSNGTEGAYFTEYYCMNCINCDPNPEGAKQCEILCAALGYHKRDKEYPKEWTYNEKDKPICTEWKKWDWGNDGDPDDPDNPKAPIPEDPNQLMLFSVADEILNNHKPTVKESLTVQN